jgi:hypothetical protein
MRLHLAIIVVGMFTFWLSGFAEDPPALKEPQSRLIEVINSTGRANFTAACINLTRDVAAKTLTVYAVTRRAKTGTTTLAGFTIRVVYHSDLAKEQGIAAGAYHDHYNSCLLDFAAAQFAEGKKELGIGLVRLLAAADTELSWSSMEIRPVTIQKILADMEGDDPKLQKLLDEAKRDWHQRERDYRL